MQLCPNISYWHLIALGLYAIGDMAFEFWIGKTDKTRASSKLELILLGIGAIIGVDLVCRIENFFQKRGK